MPFIGNKPSAVPLTSADIADSIITSAKIVDATITNSDVASSIITGQTAETSIAGGDSVLIYDDSASALRKMTRTNFVSGIGGTNTPYFLVNRSTDQSISDATTTKVSFNNETFDSNSNFDSTTNYRFTPTTSGKYYLYSNILLFGSNNGSWQQGFVAIYKNGTIHTYSGWDLTGNEARMWNVSVAGLFDANGSTDYFEIYVNLDITTGSATIIPGNSGENRSYFLGYKILT